MNDRLPRTPKFSEDELKFMEMRRDAQQYSYGLVQRLTFFIISIELVFCGYILLNSEKLGAIKFSSILFLLAGSAAVFGIVWRFLYNQTYHNLVHGKDQTGNILQRLQIIAYWFYISLTAVFLISTIIIGYLYLSSIERKVVNINPAIKFINYAA
jgi:hypothetical protein